MQRLHLVVVVMVLAAVFAFSPTIAGATLCDIHFTWSGGTAPVPSEGSGEFIIDLDWNTGTSSSGPAHFVSLTPFSSFDPLGEYFSQAECGEQTLYVLTKADGGIFIYVTGYGHHDYHGGWHPAWWDSGYVGFSPKGGWPDYDFIATQTVVPLPSTAALLATGLMPLALARRRQNSSVI